MIRVQHAPTDEQLEDLNERFGSSVRAGSDRTVRAAVRGAPRARRLGLARIRFTFARHGFAQLRGLIDALKTPPRRRRS